MKTTKEVAAGGIPISESVKEILEKGEKVLIARSPVRSLARLLWGVPLLLGGLATLYPLVWLSNWGQANGFELWVTANRVVMILPALITVLSIPFGLLSFYNSFELRDKAGRMRIGVEYVLDGRRRLIYEHRRGLLTQEYVGVVGEEEGKPKQRFGKWRFFYQIPEDVTLLSDILNPRSLPMGPIASFFGFGDVYLPSAQQGADNLLKDVWNPNGVVDMLLTAMKSQATQTADQGAPAS